MLKRRFLWNPYNGREEDYRISTSRNSLKRHIKKLHKEVEVLFKEENQNIIFATNKDGDDLGTISWVEEI